MTRPTDVQLAALIAKHTDKDGFANTDDMQQFANELLRYAVAEEAPMQLAARIARLQREECAKYCEALAENHPHAAGYFRHTATNLRENCMLVSADAVEQARISEKGRT